MNEAMSGDLLQTKLYVPRLRQFPVPRPHLIQKLNTGLNGKLTLVSAPPGFGKTTLVSSWLQQVKQPFTWLSLDKEDNEPNRFLSYFIAALQKIDAGLGQTAVSLLQSSQPPLPETILTLVINDLTTLSQQAILVLEDYHVIHNLDIHQALAFFLDNLPPQLHLVITSREDPPLPLYRLRSSGLMNGIYVHELRFSAQETAQFLQQTMNVQLAPADVAALAQRTEGWIAGLQLAALSLQDLPNAHEFVAGFAGDDRYIADYLLHEVIERQPAHIQEFLWQTAVLDRFCPSLCDAVLTAPPNYSQPILTYLEEANLFIIPLDNKREWYRYHHLFADFLRISLYNQRDYQKSNLHRRASIWFEENNLLLEAATHCLAAEEFPRAADLIEQMAETMLWSQGRWTSLLKWLKALPEAIIFTRPHLSLNYAWTLFASGQWEQVAHVLPQIEPMVQAVTETAVRQNMLGEIETIRAGATYEAGDMHQSAIIAQQALTRLAIENDLTRATAFLILGQACSGQGHWAATENAYREAIRHGKLAKNTAITLITTGAWMLLMVKQGRLQQAVSLYEQARQLGEREQGVILEPTGIAYVVMGELLRERNELEKAESILRAGIKLCDQQKGMPEAVLEGTITLARVLSALGQELQAAEVIQQAEYLLQELRERSGNVQPVIIVAANYGVRYWLTQGDLATAEAWLAKMGMSLDGQIKPEHFADYLLRARLYLAQNRLEETAVLLQQIDSIVDAKTAVRPLIECRLLQALVYQAQGNQQQAITALSVALSLAEPQGFVRLFVDEGEPMARLLTAAAQQGIAQAYSRQLLTALNNHGPTDSPQPPSASATKLLEPLRERELQTLRLMAAGLSNREIAAELYLSVNTIKAYSSRIYGKLNVHSRAEAINQAHQLGIL
ncbi:MAG: helix-turn-helix transcriptional regulator [Chloroflexi bacterium]|nr:helix-turn-helix transcriptional regulator [Chloroflexota bacterium]